MPIVIKDFTWKQTDEIIIVRIPLKGAHSSKVDVFTCDNFIKVNSPPHLCEICLRDVINETESICRIGKDEVIFELIKREAGPWDVLEAPLTKSEIIAVKQRAIEITQQKSEEKKKENELKKDKFQKLAVKEQISLDTKERNKIESLKTHEKNVAMSEFEDWKQTQVALEKKKKTEKVEPIKAIKVKKKDIFDVPGDTRSKHTKNIPAPRKSGKIELTFTPRAFPTPCRESKLAEENEWLQRQAEARRRTGFMIEDLKPEEHDPIWLKDKGDSFYKVGNYLGAISAYSHGIKLNPNMAELYSNRAAAHLALDNLQRVLQDTSKALELLTPAVEINANSRSLCHARRGTALCKLNMLDNGLLELQAAFKLCPNNKKLEEDIENVRKQIENVIEVSSEDGDENQNVIDVKYF